MLALLNENQRSRLSDIRRRPGIYLGKKELTALRHWLEGWSAGMSEASGERRSLIPEGFNEFVALKLRGSERVSYFDWAGLILQAEPDEEKAFEIFFELLDSYLSERGEPGIKE